MILVMHIDLIDFAIRCAYPYQIHIKMRPMAVANKGCAICTPWQ